MLIIGIMKVNYIMISKTDHKGSANPNKLPLRRLLMAANTYKSEKRARSKWTTMPARNICFGDSHLGNTGEFGF